MNVLEPMAFEFLRTFARTEFALKGISRYCRGVEGHRAEADWDEFGQRVSASLEAALPSHPHWQTLMLDAHPKRKLSAAVWLCSRPGSWAEAQTVSSCCKQSVAFATTSSMAVKNITNDIVVTTQNLSRQA